MSNAHETKNDPVDLPEPGPGKRDPKELDKQLDRALEDTMVASDPPATTQPDVHIRDDAPARGAQKQTQKQK